MAVDSVAGNLHILKDIFKLTAFPTEEMMMGASVWINMDGLIGKSNIRNFPNFSERFEGVINGRKRHHRVALLQLIVDGLGRRMGLVADEKLDNSEALGSNPEAVPPEIL